MTSLKGQVKYLCAAGRFEKQVKAEFSNVSYMLFLPELRILAVEYFETNVDVNSKDTKNGKTDILLQLCVWIFKFILVNVLLDFQNLD